MSATDGLRLVPLGGLGEFGLNAMVLESGERLLLIDAGVMFPTADMPGVDTVAPDFRYLSERKDRLEAIVLTHGHEDHIGALHHALEAAPAPVYGSRLTLGFVRERLRERGVRADLRTLAPGSSLSLGPFRIHPIRVAHSTLDSLALAIETPGGTVLASGDFKLDPDAPEDERTDVTALAEWGQRGVRVLLSDSTGAEQAGRTGGEDDVVPAFEDIFERTPGRVLVSCFATSIPRMQRVSEAARRHRRRVAFVGRRMAGNADVARELGLLRLGGATLSDAEVVASPREGQAVFVSGSQGEPTSALSLVAVGEHRDVAVGPGDTVVLSARAIPGNERTISRLISNLYRRGCEVVHPGTARVHVSGHGSRDDLAELLRLVRPDYLVPIHGEYRMLAQHARLAAQAGLAAERVLLVEDGHVVRVDESGARIEDRVEAGRMLFDRSGALELEDVVLRDRRHLAAQGIVVAIVVLNRDTGRLEGPPEIVTRGFVDGDDDDGLLAEAVRLVEDTLAARPASERDAPDLTRERVRIELRRLFRRRTQRRPMVLPVLMEV